MKLIVSVLILFVWSNSHAQDIPASTDIDITKRKGKMNLGWGYNRAIFSKSDIHLWGEGYNFVLRDVVAKDFPAKFNLKTYAGASSFTIPQFNVRLAYFLTDNIQVSFGYDHMKYVVQQYQDVVIDGYINHTRNNDFAGIYEGNTITITPDFLLFEHTNGLNYFSLEADYFYTPWKHISEKHAWSVFGGLGGGFVMPRSDVSVFDETAANVFHVAGFGTSLNVGTRMEFYKHFFFQLAAKGGFINLPDVLTLENRQERAAHDFFFLQSLFYVGGSWKIGK